VAAICDTICGAVAAIETILRGVIVATSRL
jgi:hypothetical protein